MTARYCGRCHACCIHLDIDDGGKPAGHLCGWLTNAGRCRHYDARPVTCREFRCMWLLGLLPIELRPDACGVLAQMVKNELGGIGINLTECQPGALAANQDLVRRAKTTPCRMVLMTRTDGTIAMYSADPAWIADVAKRNPSLSLPADVAAIELEGVGEQTP